MVYPFSRSPYLNTCCFSLGYHVVSPSNAKSYGKSSVSISAIAIYTWNYLQKLNENNIFINYHQVRLRSLPKSFFYTTASNSSAIDHTRNISPIPGCLCAIPYTKHPTHLECYTYNNLWKILRSLIKSSPKKVQSYMFRQ